MMTLTGLASLLLLSGSLSAQSIEENVRPVAQVCLAGQACVGSTGSNAASPRAAQPVAVAAPAPVAAAPAPVVAAFDAAATYQMSCFACHGTGAAGAPVVGNHEVWAARMEKGVEAVMANVVNGLNAMPPKGMCMTCSDTDLRALVNYMASQ
ncbi:MAG: cytochrome c5 family protein [Pseudohongiella sp.]|nr:cytochrome c5 family protein [Pseudohongiella sp.]